GPRASLAQKGCMIQQVTFIAGHPPALMPPASAQAASAQPASFDALARIRYRAAPVPASVEMTAEDAATVTFHKPQYGVAPGQSLVLYRDEEVLGGGVIVRHVSCDASTVV
ncbi:MAG: hypothetical protein JXC32_12810, partial [Anaerolineae bacterium]|nr:hypothetical protein [Anaerolineae bacterium]